MGTHTQKIHTYILSLFLFLFLCLSLSLSLSLSHTHTYTHTHTHTHRTFQDAVEDIYTLSQNYPEIEGHLEGPALLRQQQRMLTKEPYTCEKRPAKEPCIYQKRATKEPTCKLKQLSRNQRPPRRPRITSSLTTYAYKGALYGVATISRLLKIIGLFCRISSLCNGSFAKETCNFKEPTNRSHPICVKRDLQKVSLDAFNCKHENCDKCSIMTRYLYTLFF